MANLKTLLTDLYNKAAAYDALNTLVGQNGEKIATNIAKLNTVDGQITDLNSRLDGIRDIKQYDAEATYAVDDIIELEGVLYKCIKADAPAGTALTNTEFFASIGGGSADLTEVNAEIASIKAVTDQIQFEDLELDGVTYSLVTKKPDQGETQEPADPETPSEQTEQPGE